MKFNLSIMAFVWALVSTAPASAATLDFTGIALGTHVGALVLPEATLTSSTGTYFIGANSVDHEICPYGFFCEADLDVAFNGTVSALTFVASGFDTGDLLNLLVYNGSGGSLGSVNGIAANQLVDLTAFSGVGRVFLDYVGSGGAGFAYDHFTFNVDGQVPEPATWTLAIVGFAALAAATRRRRAAA